MGVNIEVEGPGKKQEVVEQNDSNLGTTSVSTERNVESMVSVSDEEAADYVLTYFEDRREFYSQIAGLDDTDYWVSSPKEWSARISGRNDSRPVALAASKASKKGEYENGLHALTSWSSDEDFPFRREALYLAERASGDGVIDDIIGWYDEEISFD